MSQPPYSFNKVIIFGATSAIAVAVAREIARPNCEMVLVARDQEKLDATAKDLSVRQATTHSILADFEDISSLETSFTKAFAAGDKSKDVDFVLVAHGVLSPSESTPEALADFTNINFTSAAFLAERCAEKMATQNNRGVIGVISSVAGDRGRRGNYWYGATKSALTAVISGLRSKYSSSNVHLLTIKPGFVDTPMTSDIKKGPLFATPHRVAQDIVRAAVKRRNTVYTPWFWEVIMKVVCGIPEVIFKRLSL